ncbi:MAG: hypothetical protein GQ470_00355 [Gammaproteobacteria bacterium]|nr:hypothetical protein [Gammaproteobacteria bacterium]
MEHHELDIPVAKLQHQRWRMRLDRFLKGKESLTESEAVSHRDCDMGKWMYSVGLKEYGSIPEMKDLERLHEQFHTLVRKVVQLKNSGDEAGAMAEFLKIGELSDKVINLLDTVDLKH